MRSRSGVGMFLWILFAALTVIGRSQSNIQKEELLAMKERVNRESMLILREKERMIWWRYYIMMSMQLPMAQLKQFNTFNKMQIVQLQRENNGLKMEIIRIQKEVQKLKYDTEVLKKENSIKSWKKQQKKKQKNSAHSSLLDRLSDDY